MAEGFAALTPCADLLVLLKLHDEYAHIFSRAGFDYVGDLVGIERQELQQQGVKLGHTNRILMMAARLMAAREACPQSQPEQTAAGVPATVVDGEVSEQDAVFLQKQHELFSLHSPAPHASPSRGAGAGAPPPLPEDGWDEPAGGGAAECAPPPPAAADGATPCTFSSTSSSRSSSRASSSTTVGYCSTSSSSTIQTPCTTTMTPWSSAAAVPLRETAGRRRVEDAERAARGNYAMRLRRARGDAVVPGATRRGACMRGLYVVLSFLAFLGVFLAFLGVSHKLQSSIYLQSTVRDPFAEYLHADPVQGIAVYMLLSMAVAVTGVPFSHLDIAAAFVYPWSDALAALFVVKTSGSILCYYVVRHGLPVPVRRWALSYDVIWKMNRRLTSSPVFYSVLIHLTSVPAVAKNYGLALLDVPFPAFLYSCVAGSVVSLSHVALWKEQGASQGFQGIKAADLLEQQQQEQAAATDTTVGMIAQYMLYYQYMRHAMTFVLILIMTIVLANDPGHDYRGGDNDACLAIPESPRRPPFVALVGAVPASQGQHSRRFTQPSDCTECTYCMSDTMDTTCGPPPASTMDTTCGPAPASMVPHRTTA